MSGNKSRRSPRYEEEAQRKGSNLDHGGDVGKIDFLKIAKIRSDLRLRALDRNVLYYAVGQS